MESLDSRIAVIEQRNARVEEDKRWETSVIRRVTIAVITYLTASAFLWSISSPNFLQNALVPVGGYLLSTLSLPWVRKWWKMLSKNS